MAIVEFQELLGHKSSKTSEIYTHVSQTKTKTSASHLTT